MYIELAITTRVHLVNRNNGFNFDFVFSLMSFYKPSTNAKQSINCFISSCFYTFLYVVLATTVPSTTVTQKATTVQKQATSSTAAPVTATSGKLNVTTHDPIDCELSKQVCDLRCKGEYLVDHKDCTYCVCRSDVC